MVDKFADSFKSGSQWVRNEPSDVGNKETQSWGLRKTEYGERKLILSEPSALSHPPQNTYLTGDELIWVISVKW